MNRRTWNEFITKRSTIWTLSLCLVGAIVLGGMAAVNKSRNNEDASGETELGQIAYLEEELEGEDMDSNSISADEDGVLTDEGSLMENASSNSEEVSGAVLNENTSGSAAESNTDDTFSDSDKSSGIETNAEDDSASADGIDASANSAAADNTGTADNSAAADSTGAADNSAAADSTGAADDPQTADASTAVDSADVTDGSIAADASTASSETSADTDDETVSSSDSNVSTDSEEASSSSIISEQALLEAGVSFTAEDALLWPSAGTVIIDYSMDKSVYFATLNQYKYNPALIISSKTGNQVLASAKGIVESISIDEETGTTLVLNIGNGYKLTYGQLMEAAVSEGDVVEAGDLLAYVSEPTKYYSTEGSNLYFAMTKDGEPVDPVLYLE